MVTIYRAHGLRVIIFTDDHEPAHVHAVSYTHLTLPTSDLV